MSKALHRNRTGQWSDRCLFSLFFFNDDTISDRASSTLSGIRSLLPTSRSSFLVALPTPTTLLQQHCHARQACPATLSISLVSQTIRQNRPCAFIEAPHPPSSHLSLPPSSPLSHSLEFSRWKPSREVEHSNLALTVNTDGNASTLILALTMNINEYNNN